MKLQLPLSILSAALLAAPSVFGQAYTDPVGFITLNVLGSGSINSPRLSLVSPTLTKPILYQGTISSISGTTITVSGSPWGIGAFNGVNGSHYVEIVSSTVPARSGTMTVVATTPSTNSITTVDDLSLAPQAAVGDTVRIRKDVTISDILGSNNSAGLLGSSEDASTADEVLIYNGDTSISYFYFTGIEGFPAGWYKSDDFTPSNNRVVAPNEAMVIRRKAVGALSIVSAGSVKTGNTLVAVTDGLNVLGTSSAMGFTLSDSNLRTGSDLTGVKGGEDGSIADEVILYSTGVPVSYFYFTGIEGFPAGWYKTDDFSDANNVKIEAGTAFIIKRKGGAAFNWAQPSPTSF